MFHFFSYLLRIFFKRLLIQGMFISTPKIQMKISSFFFFADRKFRNNHSYFAFKMFSLVIGIRKNIE